MSSKSPEQLSELKYNVTEELSWERAQLEQVQRQLLSDIQHQFFAWLRCGVRAVNHSFKVWAERIKL